MYPAWLPLGAAVVLFVVLYRMVSLAVWCSRLRFDAQKDDWMSVCCTHGNHGGCHVKTSALCLCACHDSAFSDNEARTRAAVRDNIIKRGEQ